MSSAVLPLGDDGLGHVLGAVVPLLHQPLDLLRGEVKGQSSALRPYTQTYSTVKYCCVFGCSSIQ